MRLNYQTFQLCGVVSLAIALLIPSSGAYLPNGFETSGLSGSMLDMALTPVNNMNGWSGTYKRDVPGPVKEEENFNDNINALISGGQPANIQEFKYQAALLINTTDGFFQICGCVLIAPKLLLTAAHCLGYITGPETYDNFVLAGAQNLALGLDNPGSQLEKVVDYRIHWQYRPSDPGHPNDIAIIKVESDIVPNANIAFANLMPKVYPRTFFDEGECVVTGWGITEHGRVDELQMGSQYIPTQQTCRDFWAVSRTARITKRHICGFNQNVAPCAGDRGGALTCYMGPTPYVTGIMSWGLPECSTCFPFIYTRVSHYERWISNVVAKLS